MNIKRIVAATDFSEASMVGVETALNLAMESKAILYLLHVLELPSGVDPMVGLVKPPLGDWREDAMRALEELVPENWEGNRAVQKVIVMGTATAEIARFAQQKAADMIVIGTHGRRGLARLLMGSTAEALLRQAPCQVLVVKQKVVPDAGPEDVSGSNQSHR